MEVRRDSRGARVTLATELAAARYTLEVAGIQMVEGVALATGDSAMASSIVSALALALREATSNIVAHSGASRVIARIWQDTDAGVAILDMMDDGRGFGTSDEGGGLR